MQHRRMKQAADVLRMEKETAEKLAAKAFAKSFLADLVPSVFNNLRENGYFYDPVHRDLETGLMPWLLESTLSQLDANLLGRYVLDNLLLEVIAKRDVDYKNLEQMLRERIEQLQQQPDTTQQTGEQQSTDEPQVTIEPKPEDANAEQPNADQSDSKPDTSNQQDDVNSISTLN